MVRKNDGTEEPALLSQELNVIRCTCLSSGNVMDCQPLDIRLMGIKILSLTGKICKKESHPVDVCGHISHISTILSKSQNN